MQTIPSKEDVDRMTVYTNSILKLTCSSFYWKLWHNLHGEGVCVTDIGDIDSSNLPFEPAYMCDSHYENHFKRFSLREMKILEPEEMEWYKESEDETWRLIKFFDGKKVWEELQNA